MKIRDLTEHEKAVVTKRYQQVMEAIKLVEQHKETFQEVASLICGGDPKLTIDLQEMAVIEAPSAEPQENTKPKRKEKVNG